MDRPWSQYCAMGIVHSMAFPAVDTGDGPIIETITRIAEDDFFDLVEIAWVNEAAVRRQVRTIVQAAHMQAGYCVAPSIYALGLDLGSLDGSLREHSVQQVKYYMDQACELGARRACLLSGADPGDAKRGAAIEALVDSLHEVCDYGAKNDLMLTLELLDRSVHKNGLIGPVDDAATVAKAVTDEHSNFGLLYDLAHMPLLNEVPGDMNTIKEHLVQAHVGNCVLAQNDPLYGDFHPRFGYPGGANGTDQVVEFIRGLFDVGYLAQGKEPRPWVSLELKPQLPGETPELIIANAKRVWREAWARA